MRIKQATLALLLHGPDEPSDRPWGGLKDRSSNETILGRSASRNKGGWSLNNPTVFIYPGHPMWINVPSMFNRICTLEMWYFDITLKNFDMLDYIVYFYLPLNRNIFRTTATLVLWNYDGYTDICSGNLCWYSWWVLRRGWLFNHHRRNNHWGEFHLGICA